MSSLSSVAAAALNTSQNELVHLAEQKLMGSLTESEHSVKVDQLLPSPDGDELGPDDRPSGCTLFK